MRSLQRLRDFKSLVSTGIREARTSLPVLGHPSCGSPERGGGTSGVLGSTSYSTTAAQQQHLFSIDAASSFSQQQRTLSSSSCTLQQQQQQQQQQQAVSEAVSSTTTLTTSTTVEEDVSSEAPRSPVSLRERLNLMPTAATAAGAKEVSMKAQVIFETSWKRIEQKYKDSIVCPREVVLLNGAPGSGKGTNIPFILKTRGMSRAVGMSQLLESSVEIRDIIEKGDLVPDALVLDAMLDAILNPDLNDGAGLVIDGFPRTAMQVDFVKLLYDTLLKMHHRTADTAEEWRFPRPSFKVVILYVDEEESVRRQRKRAQMASLHNQRALDAGTGDVWNVRTTDISEALCRRRYQVFKAHYSTILRLKQFFPFSLIDAMGTLEECRSQIVRELRYQSSLDLDERTYAAIRHLPLARDLVRVARQRLVFRLDSYCKRHYKLFLDVIGLIDTDVLPLLKQCSLAGHAEFKSRHSVLLGNTLAVDMLIDVLSDRGFSVGHAVEDRVVPRRIDLASGEIMSDWEEVHSFRITFDKENVRDLSTPSSVTTRHGEDVAIGATWVPDHMRRETSKRLEETTVKTPQGRGGSKARQELIAQHEERRNGLASSSGVNFTSAFEHHHRQMEAGGAQKEAAVRKAMTDAATSVASRTGEVSFLQDWDPMDVEVNAARMERQYGYELMNERED